MKMWWGPRIGRGDFFFAIIAMNIAFAAASYALTGRVSLTLEFGFRTQLSLLNAEPATETMSRAVADFVLLSLLWRRLQDAGRPGWWSCGLLVLPLIFGSWGALASMIGMVASFFLPPDIGPNRFGPDPRGWKSPEHHAQQQQRLRDGEV